MRASILFSLLCFCGFLRLGLIECIQHCETNQFPIFWPNGGGLKRCIDCELCHPGFGLYPNCGEKLTYPPKISCKACEDGMTFSEKYDSSGCKSCHLCAQHEIVTQDCTPRSDTVCSGTCIQGYFYHDSTRDCRKCSHCCNDGEDEKQQECINQGLHVTHQHCAPRPDKTCGPAPTTTSDQQHMQIAMILSCVGITTLLGAGFVYCVIRKWRRRIGQRNERCALRVECAPATNDGSQGAEGEHEMKRLRSGYQGLLEEDTDQPQANNSSTEKLLDSAQEDRDLSSISESRDGQPGKKGAEGGHEMKRPRGGYQGFLEEDPDQPQGKSYLPFTIEEHPETQTQPEGSRVELKCRVKGEKEVIYKWFKDEEELPEEKSSSLIRDPLKVKHFGSYRCEVSCCDVNRNSSQVAKLDVVPSDGRRYSRLDEALNNNLNTREKVENLLCKEIRGRPAWKQVASSYEMDDLSSFARCKNPGEEVIDFLLSSNPNLTVYNFCKKLKEKSIRRLDIVAALEDFLVQNDGRPNNVGKT